MQESGLRSGVSVGSTFAPDGTTACIRGRIKAEIRKSLFIPSKWGLSAISMGITFATL